MKHLPPEAEVHVFLEVDHLCLANMVVEYHLDSWYAVKVNIFARRSFLDFDILSEKLQQQY